MTDRVCFELPDGWPIRLRQTGINRFAVDYGAQTDAGLCYAEASAKLGEAIMHRLACDGAIDNRSRVEAREAGDSSPHYDGTGQTWTRFA